MSNRLLPYAVLLCAVLLLAACGSVVEEEPAPAAAEPTEESAEPEAVVEPTPAISVTVTSNANARIGPGTDHDIAYWLTVDTLIRVTGRNADATWLQIEHDGRPGWIFGALTDIDAEQLAALPGEFAQPMVEEAEPVVEPTVEVKPPSAEDPPSETTESDPAPTPPEADEPAAEPTVEPTPEPEPEAQTPGHTTTTVTVTGTVVNLRTGPGTEHSADGQVRAGMRLIVLGRNAAGDWLQIINPFAVGELVWIYASLTDIDAVLVRTLTEVSTVAIEVPTAVEPRAEEEPALALVPVDVVVPPSPDIPDCTQWHTINPNETRLSQITEWFGLDLDLVAAINEVTVNAPLTAGAQLCLHTSLIDTTVQPSVDPEPASVPGPTPQPAPDGICRLPTGQPRPCLIAPDFPERAVIGPDDVPANPPLWNPPGSYDRSEHPGLDYEFELVFSDISVLWDWRVRDFEGCYDALRTHMGEIPREAGLLRLEFRLADPFPYADLLASVAEIVWFQHRSYRSPFFNPGAIPMSAWDAYPNWNPADLPHPDTAVVDHGCPSMQAGQLVCDILPMGNSHSIHLHAATARAMANTVSSLSEEALGARYNRMSTRVLHANAYLYPLIDDRLGDPAGYGPCPDVWRSG